MLRPALVVCLLAATAVQAQPMLVTNPKMCDLPPDAYPLELGMILTSNSMEEIEYFCEFDPPITFDWSQETEVISRLGWCNEPGIITPEIFAFQFGKFEPGMVWVHHQGDQEPTVFTACPE